MKKTYKLENLGCASCAQKMEAAIGKLEGVNSAKVNFMLAKLTLEADRLEAFPAKAELQKIIASIEPYCELR